MSVFFFVIILHRFQINKKTNMNLDIESKHNQEDKTLFLPKKEIEIFESLCQQLKNVQQNLQKCMNGKLEINEKLEIEKNIENENIKR